MPYTLEDIERMRQQVTLHQVQPREVKQGKYSMDDIISMRAQVTGAAEQPSQIPVLQKTESTPVKTATAKKNQAQKSYESKKTTRKEYGYDPLEGLTGKERARAEKAQEVSEAQRKGSNARNYSELVAERREKAVKEPDSVLNEENNDSKQVQNYMPVSRNKQQQKVYAPSGQYDESKLDEYASSDYKLSDDEIKGIKKHIQDYYKSTGIKKNPSVMLNWTPEEREEYNQILTLETKTNPGSAFAAGFYNAFGVDKAINAYDEMLEKQGIETDLDNYQDQVSNASAQNPVISGAGNLTGEIAKYATTKKLLGAIPGVNKAISGTADKIKKIPALGKYGDNITNILSDTAVDTLVETIPQFAENVNSGMKTGEAAKEAAQNVGVNLGFNILGEGIEVAAPYVGEVLTGKKNYDIPKSAKQVPTLDNEIARAAEQQATAGQEIDKLAKQIETKGESGNKIIDPAEKALSDPNVEKTHTTEQIEQMHEYVSSVDQRIIDYANEIRGAEKGQYIKPLEISTVSDRAAEDIKKITGIDVTGNKIVLDKNAIEHIDKRHGKNGSADRSMADDKTLSRIQYVLDNYSNVELGEGTSSLRLANQDYAPTVVFSKKVDGNYYVVEAVTDAKKKTNRITSAYISPTELRTTKKEAYLMPDAIIPRRTSEIESEFTSSDNSIPTLGEKSNTATGNSRKRNKVTMPSRGTVATVTEATDAINEIQKRYKGNDTLKTELTESMKDVLYDPSDENWEKMLNLAADYEKSLKGKSYKSQYGTQKYNNEMRNVFSGFDTTFADELTAAVKPKELVDQLDAIYSGPEKYRVDYQVGQSKRNYKKTFDTLEEAENFVDKHPNAMVSVKGADGTYQSANLQELVQEKQDTLMKMELQFFAENGTGEEAVKDAFESRTGETLIPENGKKISKLRTNTLENAAEISDDTLDQIDQNVDFSYDPLSTQTANDMANARLAQDTAGEVKRLSSGQYKDSTDVKEAMNLLTGRADNQTLSNEDFNALAQNLARNSREYGRGLQSLKEYAGTSDDAIIKASAILNKRTDDMLADNPKLGQEIEDVAGELVEKVKEIAGIKEASEAAGELPWYDESTDVRKAVEAIINKSSFKEKVDDKAVDRIVSMLENQKDTTEIARDLNTLVANDIFGISDETIKAVDNLFAEAEKYSTYSKQRADLLSQAYAKLANEVSTSTFMDKWDAWRYLSMLGNVRTHERNIIGNQMFGAVVGIKNNVAATLEAAVDGVAKLTRGTGIDRTKSILNPLSKNDKALIKASKKDAVDEVYSLLSDGSKYNDIASAIESEKRIFKNGLLEKARKLNNELLDKEDFVALRGKYSTSLAGYLKANGADNSIFSATDKNSKDLLNKARSYAIKEAQEATFHEANELASFLSQCSYNMKNSGKTWGKVGYMVEEGILPFKKTPLNIVREGVRFSPVSLITGAADLAKIVSKGESVVNGRTISGAIDKMAKGLTGTGIMALGYWLADLGILKGSGDSDSDVNYYESAIGKQNFSIQVGDHNYTLDWAAPAALPLFVGAELQKSFDGEGVSAETVFHAMSNITEPVLETTMLSGLNDILDTIAKTGSTPNERIASLAGTTLSSYATQGIPTVAGQIARSVDDTRRDTYSEKTGLEGQIGKAINKVQNKIPVLSMKNEAYIDQWGQEEKNPGNNVLQRLAYNMLSPGYYANTSEMTDVDKEIERLYEATGNTAIAPSSYVSKVSDIRLTEKQHEQVAREMGQLQYTLLGEIINTDTYQNMSDTDKAAQIPDIYSLAKEVAADKYVDGYEGQSKLFQVYQESGTEGVLNYMALDYAAKNQLTNSDGSAKSFASASNAEKMQVMEQQDMNPTEMGKLLYNGGSGIAQGAQTAYKEKGYEGVYNYYKIKQEADQDGNGSLKKDEVTTYLNRQNMNRATKEFYYSILIGAKNNPYH